MLKIKVKCSIFHTLNCNFSGLSGRILDFSKLVGRVGFGAHSKAKKVSQFTQTEFFFCINCETYLALECAPKLT